MLAKEAGLIDRCHRIVRSILVRMSENCKHDNYSDKSKFISDRRVFFHWIRLFDSISCTRKATQREIQLQAFIRSQFFEPSVIVSQEFSAYRLK